MYHEYPRISGEIRKIDETNQEYPRLLKKIAGRPKELFLLGKLPKNGNYFAVVGTRRLSAYGKEAAAKIVSRLSEAGLVIVSGMAPGIDTIAHKTALEAGGITVAVLGTGLSRQRIYPQENLRLAERILENGGALVSELPPQTHGSRFTFPQRNRIISGMSLGTLVVEAKQRSGSLITAAFARRQKRALFAVPGSIMSLNSAGPHYLIKQGAILTESADDILKNFKLPRQDKQKNRTRQKGGADEEAILKILAEGGLPVNEIIEKTKLPPGKTLSTLNILEIKGQIKNLGGDIYAKTERD